MSILLLTAVRAVLALGVSPLTSFILTFRMVSVGKLVISGTVSSIFFYLSIVYIFLTTSLLTTLLSFLKSTGRGANLPISNLSTSFQIA